MGKARAHRPKGGLASSLARGVLFVVSASIVGAAFAIATGHALFAAFTSIFALLALMLAPVIDGIDTRAKAKRLEHPSLANARRRDAMLRTQDR